jgi:chromosome segregation ATPase
MTHHRYRSHDEIREIVEDANWLAKGGMTVREIAETLGMSVEDYQALRAKATATGADPVAKIQILERRFTRAVHDNLKVRRSVIHLEHQNARLEDCNAQLRRRVAALESENKQLRACANARRRPRRTTA